MKVIARDRCTGKTKELIRYALDNDYAILAFTPTKVGSLREKSIAYFNEEVKVVFFADLNDYEGVVLIDDVDEVLPQLVQLLSPTVSLGGYCFNLD